MKTTHYFDNHVRPERPTSRWNGVYVLEDGETVHNAFYDRRFKPEGHCGRLVGLDIQHASQ